jgi:hypothetical protein
MKFILFALGLIILGLITRLLIANFSDPALPEVAICKSLLPGGNTVGLNIKATGKREVSVDVGGSNISYGANSVVQADAFIKCLEKTLKIKVVNGVSIPELQPIGAIAHNWSRDEDLKVKLLFSDAEKEILNNLYIGPAVGTKADILIDWCSTDKFGKCAKCDPMKIDLSTKLVNVTLIANAAVKKIVMSDGWKVPSENPWELIEGQTRYVYSCSQ